jgi:hypothetical protein
MYSCPERVAGTRILVDLDIDLGEVVLGRVGVILRVDCY